MDDFVPAGNEGRMTWIPECNTICQPSIHLAYLKCYSLNINIKALTLLWIFNVNFYCNFILKRYCMSLLQVPVKGWTFSPSYKWQIYKTCHLSPVTCHLSPVTGHLSPVSCHLSPVTCHLSSVTCHLSKNSFRVIFGRWCIGSIFLTVLVLKLTKIFCRFSVQF